MGKLIWCQGLQAGALDKLLLSGKIGTGNEPGWRNGRRSGLKIRREQSREGSNPSPGTSFSILLFFLE